MPKPNSIKCPVCGGRILFHRCNDDDVYVVVHPNGDIGEVIDGKQNGYSEWMCETDKSHKLGAKMETRLEKMRTDVEVAVCGG